MNKNLDISAISYINTLKDSIDEIWDRYGDKSLESLIYSDNAYGKMQYAELTEIIKLLIHLKKSLDELSTECMDVSVDIETECKKDDSV